MSNDPAPFEFATAARIVFGSGSIRQAAPIAKTWGGRALIVTGRDSGRAGPLLEALREAGLATVLLAVAGEPDLDIVRRGIALARKENCDVVISFGGGSALDVGKAIAVLLPNPGDILDYLEVIGGGRTLPNPSAPFMAIPTTAGTGSEVTRNAVFTSPEHQLKVSLRSPFMLPRVALVDPDLTLGLPPAVTAGSGLDALTQLIEPYVSSRANPLSDTLCAAGLPHAARSLRKAFVNGRDSSARHDMSLASLCGGMALSNSGLGAVHGLAGVIGGAFPAPHGAVCAILLPLVMEANLAALHAREPANPAVERYQQVARLLTDQSADVARDGVEWVRRLVVDLQIPRLTAYGVRSQDLPELAARAKNANSMKANPLPLTHQELADVLQHAL